LTRVELHVVVMEDGAALANVAGGVNRVAPMDPLISRAEVTLGIGSLVLRDVLRAVVFLTVPVRSLHDRTGGSLSGS
jgi:hypothetical protein